MVPFPGMSSPRWGFVELDLVADVHGGVVSREQDGNRVGGA